MQSHRVAVGDTIKLKQESKLKYVRITAVLLPHSNLKQFKVRILNSQSQIQVLEKELILPPDKDFIPSISDIPEISSEITPDEIIESLSPADLEQLWSGSFSDLDDSQRLYAYWHKQLQHLTNRTMKRLAKRKLIPSSLALVKKPPLYAACIFAKAHKRAWRSKRGIVHSIRSPQQTLPGDGTSYDHIISKQPSLIPQVKGSLTHRRYQGATIFVDHATPFVHVSSSHRHRDCLWQGRL